MFQDSKFYRPAEVDLFVGDPRKAHLGLGWERNISFKQLVRMMVEADMKVWSNLDVHPRLLDSVHVNHVSVKAILA